jgi:hypothetical protein
MGRDLGVGVERKALHAGTAGTGERWRLARVVKPRADAPDLLIGPLPEGNMLLHGGRHGTDSGMPPESHFETLPYLVLRGVSSISTSSAAPPQPPLTRAKAKLKRVVEWPISPFSKKLPFFKKTYEDEVPSKWPFLRGIVSYKLYQIFSKDRERVSTSRWRGSLPLAPAH